MWKCGPGGKGRGCTAALTGCGVEVDVVRNGRRRIVGKFHFNRIAFAYADHATRNVAVKCPVAVFHTVFHGHGFFDGFHFHAYFGRVVAVDCRRYFWSVCGNRIDNGQFACRRFGGGLCGGTCGFCGSGRGLRGRFASAGG
ncbi:nitrite reductase, copper-containing domain protein [Neisseria meningitidis NM80]|nr:nitrite reductase, copper-containing domain protein [Neisseria meningitidis NM80]